MEIVKTQKKSTPLDRVWQDFLRKKKINTRFPEFLTRFWIRACGGCLD